MNDRHRSDSGAAHVEADLLQYLKRQFEANREFAEGHVRFRQDARAIAMSQHDLAQRSSQFCQPLGPILVKPGGVELGPWNLGRYGAAIRNRELGPFLRLAQPIGAGNDRLFQLGSNLADRLLDRPRRQTEIDRLADHAEDLAIRPQVRAVELHAADLGAMADDAAAPERDMRFHQAVVAHAAAIADHGRAAHDRDVAAKG